MNTNILKAKTSCYKIWSLALLNLLMVANNKKNHFYLRNHSIENIVIQAYSFASSTLLELLVKDRDLLGHLTSMKKYFLMEQVSLILNHS